MKKQTGQDLAESKKQLLTQLYCLRAGMSAVANERETVESLYLAFREKGIERSRKIRELRDKNEGREDDIDDLTEKSRFFQYVVDDFPKEEAECQEKIRRTEREKRAMTIGMIALQLIAGGSLVALIVFLSWQWISMLAAGEQNIFAYIAGTCLAIGALAAVIFFSNKKIKDAKNEQRYAEAEYRRKREYYQSCLEGIDSAKKKIASAKKQIAKNEKDIAENEKKTEQWNAVEKQVCLPFYQLGGLIQTQFEKQFQSFVSVSDWKYVDLLIFALESGRAGTMREALIYVDGEDRARHIDDAMETASQMVSRSIQLGLDDFAAGMAGYFSVISGQISARIRRRRTKEGNKDMLSQNTADPGENVASDSEDLASLAAKVDYLNALQEQRDVSSAELVEENATFMRKAREYRYQSGTRQK